MLSNIDNDNVKINSDSNSDHHDDDDNNNINKKKNNNNRQWINILKHGLKKIGTARIIVLLQKACLLGTAKIFRRTPDT